MSALRARRAWRKSSSPTDDTRIRDAVVAFGGKAVMTSAEHQSGSDRIAEAVEDLDVDLVVNVQGDEPLIDPAAIDQAVAAARETPGAIATLKSAIIDRESLLDPNIVKVVADLRGFALYFSRAPIPGITRRGRLPRQPLQAYRPLRLPQGRPLEAHQSAAECPRARRAARAVARPRERDTDSPGEHAL